MGKIFNDAKVIDNTKKFRVRGTSAENELTFEKVYMDVMEPMAEGITAEGLDGRYKKIQSALRALMDCNEMDCASEYLHIRLTFPDYDEIVKITKQFKVRYSRIKFEDVKDEEDRKAYEKTAKAEDELFLRVEVVNNSSAWAVYSVKKAVIDQTYTEAKAHYSQARAYRDALLGASVTKNKENKDRMREYIIYSALIAKGYSVEAISNTLFIAPEFISKVLEEGDANGWK